MQKSITVYYNSNSSNNAEQGLGLVDGDYHWAGDCFDVALAEVLADQLPAGLPILVCDKRAEKPLFWQRRLLFGLSLDGVELCSALSCNYYPLSPLGKDEKFFGSVKQLDNLIYLLQAGDVFPTEVFNQQAFAVADKTVFGKIFSKSVTPYAVDNLLVQSSVRRLRLAEEMDTKNQRRLPSHPLAKLHWRLRGKTTFDFSDAYPRLDDKPTLLHIGMDWGGGLQQWIDAFIDNRPEYHHLVLVSCGETQRQRYGERFNLCWQGVSGEVLDTFSFSQVIAATCVEHAEYQAMFDNIVRRHAVAGVVVSSLIGHAMYCLESGLPTLRVLHDYFPHWPSLEAKLDSATITESDINEALAHSKQEPFGAIDKALWQTWQQAENQLLKSDSVTIIAPDQSVKSNLLKLPFSECFEKTKIIPHGILPLPAVNYTVNADVFTVVVLGRVNPIKGQKLLEQCFAELAEHRDIRFVLLGCGQLAADKYVANPQVKTIADYDQSKLAELLTKHTPQLALILSQAAETFSYTLSELQSAAIPMLATRRGALNNRVEHEKNGFLCEDGEFVAMILSLKQDPQVLLKVHQQLKNQITLTPQQAFQAYRQYLPKKSISVTRKSTLIRPDDLAQALQELQHKQRQLSRKLRLSKQKTNRRTAWAESLNRQIKHLEHNLQLSQQEQQHLLKTIAEIKQQMQQESDRLKDLQSNLMEQQQQNEQQRQQLADKQNELNEVYQSRSWRLTQPLRRFTTWLRHKRNALRFRFVQVKSWPRRTVNSLRSRGLISTAKIIVGKFKKSRPEPVQATVQAVGNDFKPLQIKQPKQPKVSVIIPVYNHFEHTYHCLQSLARLNDKTTFEVIVVDDCSTDQTAEKISLVQGIRYHRQSNNGGFIMSCNTGADLASGEYLLFLNNDTEVHDNWLDSLLQTFVDFPDAGLVGSQLIYPDGRLQEAGGIVFADASGWNYGRLDDLNKPCYQHLRAVSYCSGASIIISQQLFNQLGQFDHRYRPAYYEDTDLAFATRQAGYQVYYQPQSKVTHFEGISSGTDLSSGTKKYQLINQQKFLEKWQAELQKQPQSGTDIELARFQSSPKRVLICDACTPTPDQDSGSLRMQNLMQIFHDLGFQVTFIPENMAHFGSYTEALQAIGVECIYAPTFATPIDYLHDYGEYFDVVLLSRYYIAEPLLEAVKSNCKNAQIWFDTVDLHYLREMRMAELANDEKQQKAALKTKKKELAIARQADVTLVVSPFEQAELKQQQADLSVQVLSNIHQLHGCLKDFAERRDLVFIGGYQHTPNVDGILWFVEQIWPKIKAAISDIQLHVVGSKAPPEIERLGEQAGIVFHGFVEDIEPIMSDYRIAVAPLRFGAGVKGKVNMSMSYGQPVVGTTVAVEGMYTTHGEDVLMADEPEEFAEQVIKLYQDQQLWQRISQGGLNNVETWFSFAAAKKQVEKLLQN